MTRPYLFQLLLEQEKVLGFHAFATIIIPKSSMIIPQQDSIQNAVISDPSRAGVRVIHRCFSFLPDHGAHPITQVQLQSSQENNTDAEIRH